jgi:hypothetical protein
MSDYSLTVPNLYQNKWLIFPDSTFSGFNYSDCNDTIDGVCHENITLDQCIDICDKSPYCESGHYINSPNKTYCLPLRKYSENIRDLSPYYRIRQKHLYPELRNYGSTVFINEKVYTYPPNMPNVMFYKDVFYIKLVGKESFLSIENDSNKIAESTSPIILLRSLPSSSILKNISGYVPIQNNDSIIINIPHSSLILGTTEQGELEWFPRSTTYVNNSNTFTLHKSNDTSDLLTYGDTFEIRDKNNNLVNIGGTTLFTFSPAFDVYYCDKNKKCLSIPLSKCDTNGKTATYSGYQVYRNPGCWSFCLSSSSLRDKSYVVFIIMAVLIVLIIITVFLYNYIKM